MRLREIAAYRLGRADRALREHSGQLLVLAYHNIRPHGARVAGERGLHLAQRDFARQLDFLTRTHHIRSLADLPIPIPADRPSVVITFDDGYRGALSAGVDELAKRGLPATFFVAPSRLENHTFWWDHLAEQSGGQMADAARRECLEALRGEDERVRHWARNHGLEGTRDVPDWARTVTAAELAKVAATTGMTVASHTWSHANLATLEPEEVDAELRKSAEWLKGRFPGTLPWVSFPYGRAPADTQAVARAGHQGAVLIGDGVSWMDSAVPRPALVPRLNVSAGVPLERFALTMSGAW